MENILDISYNKALSESESNTIFYKSYKKSHENLISTLNTFRDAFEPEILVPVCSRVFMRGNLIHTNEVTVSLGCGYFTKCSSKSAQEICQRRISKANNILNNLEKEKEYLESQLKFKSENIYSENQKEIIEPYDEVAESNWRKQHGLRLKEYRKKENTVLQSGDHEEIMQKLELLELQEDIERLYADHKFIKPTEYSLPEELNMKTDNAYSLLHIENKEDTKNICNNENNSWEDPQDSKELVLRKKLAELRQRKKEKCNTEEDVFKRLDELEEEEEIEDELDRLYDYIYGNNVKNHSEETSESDEESLDTDTSAPSGRRVSFPDLDVEVQTVNINFKHSENGPQKTHSSDNKDIVSPSDIYKMFPENFKYNYIKGIIKNCHKVKEEGRNEGLLEEMTDEIEYKKSVIPASINIGNVVEHQSAAEVRPVLETKRPVSKFKSMRMANKKS